MMSIFKSYGLITGIIEFTASHYNFIRRKSTSSVHHAAPDNISFLISAPAFTRFLALDLISSIAFTSTSMICLFFSLAFSFYL